MIRRDFLKLLGASAFTAGVYPTRLLGADERPILLVTVQATGGWDPSFLFAPQARGIAPFNPADVQQIGAFSVVPSAPAFVNFVKAYHQRLMVLNGVDGVTPNHFVAERYAASGKLAEGHPHIGALWAASQTRKLELPFACGFGGGYRYTANHVPLSPILPPHTMQELVTNDQWLRSADEAALINAAIAARQKRVQNAQRALPGERQQAQEFFSFQQREGAMAKVPGIIKDLTDQVPAPANNDVIINTVRTALAYCHAGLSNALSFACGAFDTHSNHDSEHPKAIQMTFEAIDYLLRGAAHLGFEDRVLLMMVSDFGRTAKYNEGRGKDHWPIGSALLMGPGIPGNRLIGAIDRNLAAVKVNPKTLKADDAGVSLRPEHIHMAVRQALGIAEHPLVRRYPLSADFIDLLG